MNKPTLLSQLAGIVGEKNILADESSKLFYGKDRTQNYLPNPSAIVFPQHEEQVIALVTWANKTKTALVPSGGRTGYSGGAVAACQEVVVAFDKMNRIFDFDPEDQTVKCQPGVITKNLQDFAAQHNLYYPIDFASSGSSQMGGNIATNAGGIKVIRYGSTRHWVYGLRVVTGNGDVLDLNQGLVKNNSGYDLRHLLIGSEGTLGLITEATMKLTVPPNAVKVALFAIQHKNALMELLKIFQTKLQITAFEFFSEAALQHVIDASELKHPFQKRAEFYVLLEYESDFKSDEFLLQLAEECLQNGLVLDAVINDSLQQAKSLWRLREDISMALSKHSPYKYDIAVKPSKISSFIEQADQLLAGLYPNFEVIWFGHVCDGNLHLNILKPKNMENDEFFLLCQQKSEAVYSLVRDYQGTLSAEHGIGLTKKNFLSFTKSEVEIEYLRSIKKIFDVNNILNPGKIF